MSAVAIRVKGVGKRYRLGSTGSLADLGRGALALLSGGRRDRDVFWALREVDFTMQRGEVVGVIGDNGAGKSTLLKILARIVRPTEGRVELWGRVGSLLEVGTGFHSELTGHENIFMNGAILGMRRAEIARRYAEIIDFAEIGPFLHTPVKRYSSGMVVRLAFAVAAHLQPEILLIDEVLAVGDAAFQRKCLGRMDAVSRQGRTILFVSHNMQAIRNLCSRAILIAGGRIRAAGPVDEVIDTYLATNQGVSEGGQQISRDMHATYPPHLEIFRLEIINAKGELSAAVRLNECFRLRIHYRIHDPTHTYRLGLQFFASDTTRIATLTSTETLDDLSGAPGEEYILEVSITNVFLPGLYRLDLTVGSQIHGAVDKVTGFTFEVVPVADDADTVIRKRKGFVWLDATWGQPRATRLPEGEE